MRRGSVVFALLAHAACATACPVCFDADARVAWFYRLSTVFLSLLPFAIVGLVATVAWRFGPDALGDGSETHDP